MVLRYSFIDFVILNDGDCLLTLIVKELKISVE